MNISDKTQETKRFVEADAERWQVVKKLFERASEISGKKRAEFLQNSCGDDAELKKEVERLLFTFESSEDFLENPAVAEAISMFVAEPDGAKEFLHELDSMPENIGVYKINRLLGKGGMGSVYLAVRNDEIKRRVAVKVIKRGMDTEEILRRFRNERQILAALEHPNIAKLIDGGTTEDGLSYFVMEYIEGLPLLEYCRRHQLNTKECLKIFRDICSAVSYAHRNLIVHRDLKPSNILVTADGIPKLLDFGIAKMLNPELSGQTLNPTLTAMRLMTPDYASPEQVRGESITTSSDIYSLGVLLYELLIGLRPYQIKNVTQAEIFRAVCDTEPPLPSAVMTERLNSVTKDVGVENTPAVIRNPKSLRGDIDNIILMALRKEPVRRYSTVDQFSEDLRFHLEGLPVIARPNTLFYRIGKFVKRQKVAVASAAFLVTLLTGFGITQYIQSNRVAKERDQAQIEKIRAEKVTAFMTELFKSANPNETNGEQVTARQLLDKGYERIQNELNDQPEVKAKLLLTMAKSYETLSVLDKAEILAEESLVLHRQIYGNENQETLAVMEFLSSVKYWDFKPETGLELQKEAFKIRQKIYGETFETAQSLNQLALRISLVGNQNPDETEQMFLKSLAMARRAMPPNDARLQPILKEVAVYYLEHRTNLPEAEKYAREVVESAERQRNEKPYELSLAYTILGRVLQAAGKFSEAEKYLLKVIEIRRNLYKEPNQLLSNALVNLGANYVEAGEFEKAEPLLREGLEIRQKIKSFITHHCFYLLGVIRFKQGKLDEAGKLLQQARDGETGTEQNTSQFDRYLAMVWIRKGKAREAEELLQTDIEKTLKKNGKYRMYAELVGVLGESLLAQKRASEAQPYLTESYEILRKLFGENHPLTIESKRRLES